MHIRCGSKFNTTRSKPLFSCIFFELKLIDAVYICAESKTTDKIGSLFEGFSATQTPNFMTKMCSPRETVGVLFFARVQTQIIYMTILCTPSFNHFSARSILGGIWSAACGSNALRQSSCALSWCFFFYLPGWIGNVNTHQHLPLRASERASLMNSSPLISIPGAAAAGGGTSLSFLLPQQACQF